MCNFFFVVGVQGTMQVLTIVIMARFVTGLLPCLCRAPH
jgi:hypothetical protein